jgi:hypothetical protein
MKAERLRSVVDLLLEEFRGANLGSVFSQLSSFAQQALQNPNDPAAQSNYSKAIKALRERMLADPYRDWPESYKDIASEIGASDLLGNRLLERIDQASRNSSLGLPSLVAELNQLHQEANGLQQRLDAAATSLKGLGVQPDELEAGEAEMGILLPRDAFDETLRGLADEAREFDKNLRPFAELGGDAGPIRLRSISSSDWQLYVLMSLGGLSVVNWVLRQIVAVLKNLVEIRKTYSELTRKNLPPEATDGLKAYADAMLATKLREVAEQAVEKFGAGLAEDRKNELKNYVTQSCKFLVTRIDKGLRIDLRVEYKKTEDAGAAEQANADGQQGALPERETLRALAQEMNETASLLTNMSSDAKGQLYIEMDEEGLDETGGQA